MHTFKTLTKLKKGDKVAIVSPSFAGPGVWPHVYELGLNRLKEIFELNPISYSTTSKVGASTEERKQDLIDAFSDPDIKAVITSLGGDDQVTYIKNIPGKIFQSNPKPFFGYSDNTHLINHLWLNGIPSFYGGGVLTEFASQGHMDKFTIKYLKLALFETGEYELEASPEFSDIGHDWGDTSLLNTRRRYQPNEGWYWDGNIDVQGITWGGCLESIDELLRCGITIPSLDDFSNIILFIETSEEMPDASYVMHVLRGLGVRGILQNIQGMIVGRPKAWEFDKQKTDVQKEEYKKEQRDIILETVRAYNLTIPIVQNLDIGHTAPQICLPVGRKLKINCTDKKIHVEF